MAATPQVSAVPSSAAVINAPKRKPPVSRPLVKRSVRRRLDFAFGLEPIEEVTRYENLRKFTLAPCACFNRHFNCQQEVCECPERVRFEADYFKEDRIPLSCTCPVEKCRPLQAAQIPMWADDDFVPFDFPDRNIDK